MASRRRAREFALLALYEADLAEVGVAAALSALWPSLMEGEGIDPYRPPDSEEVEFAQRLAYGVEEHRSGIDELIESCSTNWRLQRMPVIDRNVLRLAAFELTECSDIPATVTINEAVELAKRFGTAESRAFVNGIVDQMGRRVGRLPAEGRR